MSQFIVDEHLAKNAVLEPLRKRYKVEPLQELRPDERVLDDRVPAILCTLRQPTFLTLDRGFWDRALCHEGYGILFFDLPTEQQHRIPEMLREVLQKPEFSTRAARMGKVVRVHVEGLECWELHSTIQKAIEW